MSIFFFIIIKYYFIFALHVVFFLFFLLGVGRTVFMFVIKTASLSFILSL